MIMEDPQDNEITSEEALLGCKYKFLLSTEIM